MADRAKRAEKGAPKAKKAPANKAPEAKKAEKVSANKASARRAPEAKKARAKKARAKKARAKKKPSPVEASSKKALQKVSPRKALQKVSPRKAARKVSSGKAQKKGSGDQDKLAAALDALGYEKSRARELAKRPDAGRWAVRGAALRMLWGVVIDEDAKVGDEPRWLEGWLRGPRSKKTPPVGVAAALERVLACGVDQDDLTDVVRAMQYDAVWNFCDFLDGEGIEELRSMIPGLPEMSWRLYAVDENEDGEATPLWPIVSLHESIGRFDPAGRGGEPRSRS